MKTIKTTISTAKYFLLALLVAFSFSCSPEDGADGAQGEQGIAGTNGANGNANVQIYTFDLSSESGYNLNLPVPGLTEQMVEENAILVSYTASSGLIYMAPGPGSESTYATKVYFSSSLNLGFRTYDGGFYTISAGDVLSARVFVIEPSSTTGSRSSTSSKQQVYNQLNNAGINVNDYYAVCDFYGIAY